MTITLTQANEQGIAPWDDLVWQNDHVTVFRDRFPVTPGHMLFVPRIDTPQIIHRAMAEAQLEGDRLVATGDCDGYNIGLNMGRAAGQTVMYPHVHLIPRRSGDCTDPTGGVRGVIPSQQNYHKDTYKKLAK
jgi:diadenosine tetraphosphate (Ap4A) HIT family hydrolase